MRQETLRVSILVLPGQASLVTSTASHFRSRPDGGAHPCCAHASLPTTRQSSVSGRLLSIPLRPGLVLPPDYISRLQMVPSPTNDGWSCPLSAQLLLLPIVPIHSAGVILHPAAGPPRPEHHSLTGGRHPREGGEAMQVNVAHDAASGLLLGMTAAQPWRWMWRWIGYMPMIVARSGAVEWPVSDCRSLASSLRLSGMDGHLDKQTLVDFVHDETKQRLGGRPKSQLDLLTHYPRSVHTQQVGQVKGPSLRHSSKPPRLRVPSPPNLELTQAFPCFPSLIVRDLGAAGANGTALSNTQTPDRPAVFLSSLPDVAAQRLEACRCLGRVCTPCPASGTGTQNNWHSWPSPDSIEPWAKLACRPGRQHQHYRDYSYTS